jgi:hypothetical protein
MCIVGLAVEEETKSMEILKLSKNAKRVSDELEAVREDLLKREPCQITHQMRRKVANNFFIAHSGIKRSMPEPRDFYIDSRCDDYRIKEKLKSGGVEVRHIIIDGTIHGFMTYGKDFVSEVETVLTELKIFNP